MPSSLNITANYKDDRNNIFQDMVSPLQIKSMKKDHE